MKTREELVYKFYKDLYPDGLVLFRVKDKYVALFEDAQIVKSALPEDCQQTDFGASISATNPALIAGLASNGTVVQIVSCRNNNGEYDYPDIDEISRDKQEDY